MGTKAPVVEFHVGEPARALLDLHIAEYNALTSRNATWIVVQSNAAIFIIASLTVIGGILAVKPDIWPIVSWVATFVFQVELLGSGFATQEIYRNALYIEKYLQPLVRDLTQTQGFWRYEAFLVEDSSKTPQLTDYVPVYISVAISIAVALIRYQWGASCKELSIGLFALCFSTACVIAQTLSVSNLRKQLREAAQNNAAVK